MRKAINENPVVQVVALGILGIVVAFLFMTRVMGGNEAEEPAAPATSATTAPVPDVGAVPAAPAVEPTGAATVPATVEGAGFETGAGLPASVVSAYESGDVVVLLVVQEQGIEDKKLRAEVESLRARGDTSVFVVPAKDVARYSRIAAGLDLDRVPALIVIAPKKQAGGGLPDATISYGFRGPDAVEQTVRDALYDGKRLPYHPG